MAQQFDREAALVRADKFAQQGKLRPAIHEYRRVLEHAPDDLTVLNVLGDLYLRANEPKQAADCFERLGSRFVADNAVTKAIAVYKKLARLDERNVEVQYTLAELSSAGKRKREARRYYLNAVALNGASITGKRPLSILQAICDLDPTDTELRLELAANYVNGGFPFEAHEAYVAAGRELLRLGDEHGAFSAFEQALALNPISRPALSALSDLLLAQERAGDAVELVRKALDDHPLDVDLLVILGRTHRRAGNLDDAERVFTRLFEVDPTRSEYLFEIASMRASEGNVDRAMAIVNRCFESVVPTRRRDKLVSLLRQIVTVEPEREEALERLVDIYARTGDAAKETDTVVRLVDLALARGAETRAVLFLQRLVRVAPDPEPFRRQLVALIPQEPESTGFEVELVREAEGERGLALVGGPGAQGSREAVGEQPRVLEAPVAERPPVVDAPATATATALAQETVIAAGPPEQPAREPDLIEERLLTLKDAYLRAGFLEQAETQWLELARHYGKRGDEAQAKDALFEAFRLNPSTALRRKRSRAYRQAETPPEASPLSKVLIVRQFDECLDSEWRRAARVSKPVALLRIRIDRMRGHDAPEPGVEEGVAQVIEATLHRSSDLLGRCGGGEFVALLPDTFAEGAAVVARKIHDSVRAYALEREGAEEANLVTVSIGIASAPAKRGTPPDGLVRAADRASRSAAESGGNRTVVAGSI